MILSPVFKQRFLDSNGAPLAGGLLYSYIAGTTTPQTTYSNSTGTANTNPVVLDSQGYADVWLDPTLAYKIVLKDSGGNQQWSEDNVYFPTSGALWNANTTYQMGQIAYDSSGYGLIYVSLTNNNTGNALSSVSNWRVLDGNVRTVSTSQTSPTLLVTDNLIRSNSTSGNLTHTLPACSTTPIGKVLTIKDVGTGGNTTSVVGSGTDHIDGNNTYALTLSQYDTLVVQNNGTSWDVLGVPQKLQIGTANIAAQAVTAAQIANATITGTQVSNNINLPGTTVQESGRNVVVAGANASTSQAIVRGTVLANGTTSAGEGFTATHVSTGVYTLTWTNAFASNPSVTVTAVDASANTVAVLLAVPNTTGASLTTLELQPSIGVAADAIFCFTAIGPR